MGLLNIVLPLLIVFSALGIAIDSLSHNDTALAQAQQRALSALVPRARSLAISALQDQGSHGLPYAVPTVSPLPLCEPTAPSCAAYATITYTQAGTTNAPAASASNTETASNLLGVVSEGRVVLDARIEIIDSAHPCAGAALSSGTCAIPARTAQMTIRLLAAAPYAIPDGGFSSSQVSQTGTSAGAPDYGGCDGATGCGSMNPSGIAHTPDPTTLLSNPTCTLDSYGACPATTAPPPDYHDVTFQNSNIQ